MKKLSIAIIFGLLFFSSGLQAQYASSRLLPNAINGNDSRGTLGANLNIGLNHKQLQLNYNLTDDFFVFGSYNLTNAKTTLPKLGDRLLISSLFGLGTRVNRAELQSKGRGFSIGGGIHHRSKKNPNHFMEFIGAFDHHRTLDIVESYSEEVDPWVKIVAYQGSKYSLQFNSMYAKSNWVVGYSLRLGLLKPQTWHQSLEWGTPGPATYLLEPTFNLNYRPLANKSLTMNLQTGFSTSYFRQVNRDGFTTTTRTGSSIRFLTSVGITYAFSGHTN